MTAALRLGGGLALLVAVIAAACVLNGYYIFVLGQIALLTIVGIGLNILIGLSGQISFGHAGFYALGAYAVAIPTSRGWLSFWIAWPLGALISAALGAVLALPALRVKGPYLAMVTIAFGLVIEQSLVEFEGLTGGQNGILDIPTISLAGLALGDRGTVILALVTAAILFVCFLRLSRGNWGAALRAVRDSEAASASIGIDPIHVRIVAFVLSAFCAGLAGGLFAPMAAFVTPQSFNLSLSILFVLVVVIGGSGARSGPIIGAIVVGLLPELLSAFEAYRLLAYGVLVLIVLWLAPGGIAAFLPRAKASKPDSEDGRTIADLLFARARRPLGATGLTIAFGGIRAVNSVDLTIAPGQVTALIGPNGAGKSTVINMLSGFYRPDTGECRLGADRLAPGKPFFSARTGVARTYQRSALFESLSIENNVILAMRRGRLGPLLAAGGKALALDAARARGLLRACGYLGSTDALAGGLAHVDRRLVEIARALATDPDVILLDEPAAGLSQAEKRQLGSLLRSIAGAGIGICLVEHDMALVMTASDAVVVLRTGTLIAAGTPAQVQADPVVREAYLGGGTIRNDAPAVPARGADHLNAYALHAGYGAASVLSGIDISVRRGEAVALLGANGAGKSTLMRVLAGLLPPTQGTIRLNDTAIDNLSAAGRVRHGLALVPEGRQVFPELSVRDNIRLGGFIRRAGSSERLESMLERFPRLRERIDQRAGLLSGGEQQMLAVARALMAEPKILLLDEPSLGLAPQIAEELFQQLRQLCANGISLLIVDQLADLALAVASRAYVLREGHVVAEGSAIDIAANPALAAAYLGDG
ncbi:ATP-binding cassette domain-containing protein [Sphingobium aromaticiconvertens]|uniref:ATP-binding cassette domain-containing protein n=1 Tax=Sphingobium aromaticiconvertens TaxID=365341 RepID=UPI0030162E29